MDNYENKKERGFLKISRIDYNGETISIVVEDSKNGVVYTRKITPEFIKLITSCDYISGVEKIAVERTRQVVEEECDDKHDDTHTNDQLAKAASIYSMPAYYRRYFRDKDGNYRPVCWPNGWKFKPEDDRIKELAKAGAMIAAEIDRLLRKGKATEEQCANKNSQDNESKWLTCISCGKKDENVKMQYDCGLCCGAHHDNCFRKMISECRKRSW